MHKFSVLLSIYGKESPVFFEEALNSIWYEQTVRPTEIVIVKDGKLTDELEHVLKRWEERLQNKLRIVALSCNLGLGDALRHGLERCSFELIARMDTDDISLPNRFETQIKHFKADVNLGLLGSAVGEFSLDPNQLVSKRIMPASHDDIVAFSRSRNPFNHPSVMFKKSKVIDAGNYQKFAGLEDYYLWVRMILKGTKMQNLPETLVHMRAGTSMLARRGGLDYAKSEIKFFVKLFKLGHISVFTMLMNIFLRIPVRLSPKFLRKAVYRVIRL